MNTILTISDSDFNLIINTNIKGTVNTIKAALPHMISSEVKRSALNNKVTYHNQLKCHRSTLASENCD